MCRPPSVLRWMRSSTTRHCTRASGERTTSGSRTSAIFAAPSCATEVVRSRERASTAVRLPAVLRAAGPARPSAANSLRGRIDSAAYGRVARSGVRGGRPLRCGWLAPRGGAHPSWPPVPARPTGCSSHSVRAYSSAAPSGNSLCSGRLRCLGAGGARSFPLFQFGPLVRRRALLRRRRRWRDQVDGSATYTAANQDCRCGRHHPRQPRPPPGHGRVLRACPTRPPAVRSLPAGARSGRSRPHAPRRRRVPPA